jgi:[acyl-carrier-protein] S-malonyltransferase
MASRGINKFVEIGPNKVLSHLVKRIDQSISTKSIGNIGDIDGFFNESLILTAENLKVGLS